MTNVQRKRAELGHWGLDIGHFEPRLSRITGRPVLTGEIVRSLPATVTYGCNVGYQSEGLEMLNFVYRAAHVATNFVSQFDRQHWLWISVAVLALGLLCLRGFGSRTNY